MIWNGTPRPPARSTLHHVAVMEPGARFWVVGYQVHGTREVVVLEEGHTEDSAKGRAKQLNFPRSSPSSRGGWSPESAVYASGDR